MWNQFDQDDNLEFRRITEEFFLYAQKGAYDLFVSDIVLWEIEECPDKKRREQLFGYIEKYTPALLSFDEDAQKLRDKYLEAGILTDTRRNRVYDAGHVAVATVNQMPYLLTFNLKHLLKANRIERFNGVNLLNGYGTIQLVKPEIFIPDEREA